MNNCLPVHHPEGFDPAPALTPDFVDIALGVFETVAFEG